MSIETPSPLHTLSTYRSTLLDDVMPFWLRHGLDQEHGGYFTALNRDGSVIDTDKSIWFQGRGAWMFATLHQAVKPKPEWLAAATTGIDFLRRHSAGANGKMYFTVTREGNPLRMRRYVYSESFAAIANASYSRVTGDERAAAEAVTHFSTYLKYCFEPGHIPAKTDRPMTGIGSYMIAINTAQEIRANLGDVSANGKTCTGWIDRCIAIIERDFMKPEIGALMEVIGPGGDIIDHFDGRMLNPGHAIEAAWFIMHEGKHRSDQRLIAVGLKILDWMWERGWDKEYGGLFYFRDVRDLPVQEYWHDMKFWWPHCEAMIATLLAWTLTGDNKYARWHQMVHDWSFAHFADREHGEWYGYLHRDGKVSVPLKGNMWKGPFHLPRALLYCWQLLEQHSHRETQ
jgi:N-acylglucosamine 2-epimerase